MKSFAYAAPVAAALVGSLFGTVTAQSVDPIVIKGTKFFYKTNGTQFFIKGVAYQQDFMSDGQDSSDGYTDPLADPDGCRRDLPYLVQLSTNTIRVYAVDPTKDHSECMNMFANAGIYVIADLGSPSVSIESNTPAWNTEIYERYTGVVDSLANYTNTLGFFAGNEVITMPNNTFSAPFVKAAVRDTKAYIKSKYRPIGVGYAAEDNQYVRDALSDYMNCGSNQDDAVDFFGQNVYSWCGDSSFTQSGYNMRVENYQNYSVPVFFAEYGCNTAGTRLFTETPVLYGSMMDDVFSGGIVYLYFQEANNYGLVSVSGSSVSELPDFNNLKTEIATVSPSRANSASYSPTNSPRSCPTGWANFTAAASPLPPTPDSGLCDCMYSSLGCTVASGVSEQSYGEIFGYVCGLDGGRYCSGIAANGTTGKYGQYGMCDSKQQLGYVLNQYYVAQNSDASACSFSGSAATQAAATPSGSCRAQLSSASVAMSASGGSGGSGGASSSSGAASGINNVFHPAVGSLAFWLFIQLALVSGVGMIML